jgi:hypothetical protein
MNWMPVDILHVIWLIYVPITPWSIGWRTYIMSEGKKIISKLGWIYFSVSGLWPGADCIYSYFPHWTMIYCTCVCWININYSWFGSWWQLIKISFFSKQLTTFKLNEKVQFFRLMAVKCTKSWFLYVLNTGHLNVEFSHQQVLVQYNKSPGGKKVISFSDYIYIPTTKLSCSEFLLRQKPSETSSD